MGLRHICHIWETSDLPDQTSAGMCRIFGGQPFEWSFCFFLFLNLFKFLALTFSLPLSFPLVSCDTLLQYIPPLGHPGGGKVMRIWRCVWEATRQKWESMTMWSSVFWKLKSQEDKAEKNIWQFHRLSLHALLWDQDIVVLEIGIIKSYMRLKINNCFLCTNEQHKDNVLMNAWKQKVQICQHWN